MIIFRYFVSMLSESPSNFTTQVVAMIDSLRVPRILDIPYRISMSWSQLKEYHSLTSFYVWREHIPFQCSDKMNQATTQTNSDTSVASPFIKDCCTKQRTTTTSTASQTNTRNLTEYDNMTRNFVESISSVLKKERNKECFLLPILWIILERWSQDDLQKGEKKLPN